MNTNAISLLDGIFFTNDTEHFKDFFPLHQV